MLRRLTKYWMYIIVSSTFLIFITVRLMFDTVIGKLRLEPLSTLNSSSIMFQLKLDSNFSSNLRKVCTLYASVKIVALHVQIEVFLLNLFFWNPSNALPHPRIHRTSVQKFHLDCVSIESHTLKILASLHIVIFIIRFCRRKRTTDNTSSPFVRSIAR